MSKLIFNETEDGINKLKKLLRETKVVIIGAGSGLSTSAGFEYDKERFYKYFKDFSDKYNIHDMYSGGFYKFESLEEKWAWWSRQIFVNRYVDIADGLYKKLYALIKDKDYFVITTNVDHCFQKAGFDKERLFYTQGDYGLFQCSVPCHDETYDNEYMVKDMLIDQGFEIDEKGIKDESVDFKRLKMKISFNHIPLCPRCKKPMTTNLRADDSFVQDKGWVIADKRYSDFLFKHKDDKVLFLDLGSGFNTPLLYALRYKTEDKKSKKTQETVYRYKSYKGVNLGRCA